MPYEVKNPYLKVNEKKWKCLECELVGTTEDGAVQLSFNSQRCDALAWGTLGTEEKPLKKYFPTEETTYMSGTYSISASVTFNDNIDPKFRSIKLKAGDITNDLSYIYPDGAIVFAHFLNEEHENVVIPLEIMFFVLRINDGANSITINTEGHTNSYTRVVNGRGILDEGAELWIDNPDDPDNPVNPETTDPYENGGYSSEGGGDGLFDSTSSIVDYSGLDYLNDNVDINNSMVTVLNANLEQLISLSKKLFSADFLNQLSKVFYDVEDVIVAIRLLPYTPALGGAYEIKVGWLETGVVMNRISHMYNALEWEEIEVQQFYNAKWDYSPYTKIRIFLPYIGFRDLDPDEVMGKKVGMRYIFDNYSGEFLVQIKVDGSVLYTYTGNCSVLIPWSGRNFTSLFTATVNGLISAGVGMTLATNIKGKEGVSREKLVPTRDESLAAIGGAAGGLMHAKPAYAHHTGDGGGIMGLLNTQYPYIVYEIPRQLHAYSEPNQLGLPSNIYMKLGNCRGFTSVRAIHLENIPALSEELDEIERYLRKGVLL